MREITLPEVGDFKLRIRPIFCKSHDEVEDYKVLQTWHIHLRMEGRLRNLEGKESGALPRTSSPFISQLVFTCVSTGAGLGICPNRVCIMKVL